MGSDSHEPGRGAGWALGPGLRHLHFSPNGLMGKTCSRGRAGPVMERLRYSRSDQTGWEACASSHETRRHIVSCLPVTRTRLPSANPREAFHQAANGSHDIDSKPLAHGSS